MRGEAWCGGVWSVCGCVCVWCVCGVCVVLCVVCLAGAVFFSSFRHFTILVLQK